MWFQMVYKPFALISLQVVGPLALGIWPEGDGEQTQFFLEDVKPRKLLNIN
jgi:hypothetical protein